MYSVFLIHPLYIAVENLTKLSILHEINASRSFSKKLPVEILLQILNQVHKPNTIYHHIRSAWTPIDSYHLFRYQESWNCISFMTAEALPLATAIWDGNTKRYHIPDTSFYPIAWGNVNSLCHIFCQISSADFLYRL